MSKWTEDQQIVVYGVTEAEVEKQLERALRFSSIEMVCASMLSDVQEMIERGFNEEARQRINVVKHALFFQTKKAA